MGVLLIYTVRDLKVTLARAGHERASAPGSGGGIFFSKIPGEEKSLTDAISRSQILFRTEKVPFLRSEGFEQRSLIFQ